MMELDDLKNTWQTLTQEDVARHKVDEDALKLALSKRSQNAAEKIKKGLRLDLGIFAGFVLLVCVLFVLGVLDADIVQPVLIIAAIFMPALVYLNYMANSLLNRLINANENLKESLQSTVEKMGFGIKTVLTFSALAPGLGFIIGYVFVLQADFSILFDIKQFGFIVIGAIISCVVYFPFARWYVNKLVGHHFYELKDCYEELVEGEG